MSDKVIAAGEARRMSEENQNITLQQEMDMVRREIEKSIAGGKMEAVIFKELRKATVEKLRALGYKVEKRNAGYNDIDTVISW